MSCLISWSTYRGRYCKRRTYCLSLLKAPPGDIAPKLDLHWNATQRHLLTKPCIYSDNKSIKKWSKSEFRSLQFFSHLLRIQGETNYFGHFDDFFMSSAAAFSGHDFLNFVKAEDDGFDHTMFYIIIHIELGKFSLVIDQDQYWWMFYMWNTCQEHAFLHFTFKQCTLKQSLKSVQRRKPQGS